MSRALTAPKKKRSIGSTLLTVLFVLVCIVYMLPVVEVGVNSFKTNAAVNTDTFALPNSETFVGFDNYVNGMNAGNYPFWLSALYSLFITVVSAFLILLCTSMAAWYIARVSSRFARIFYYICVFSMVVPFQMVMFTGFVKSLPLEIEEAAAIDGCGPIRTFFCVVLPMLKPTMISVGILEVMWLWNDYLLPYLSLNRTKYMTIPMYVQYLKGSYGSVDMGAFMAIIFMSILPIIVVYLFCQKHIIKGVAAGAVKG